MSREGTESDKKSRPHQGEPGMGRSGVRLRGRQCPGGCPDRYQDDEVSRHRISAFRTTRRKLRKRIPQLTVHVTISADIVTATNGGQSIELRVLRSAGIAATSDGRYFIRVADETKRLMPDELQRLLNDKGAYVWEAQTTQTVPRGRVDEPKRSTFLALIRGSDRVSQFLKDKIDDEVLDYYLLTKGDQLTNLGVLWIGRREDRATLTHAPVVQFIKYDETGAKVNKLAWDYFSKNPLELIEAAWTQVPDWRESYELPDGLFRRNVPHFDEVVIRELLANALVHRFRCAACIALILSPRPVGGAQPRPAAAGRHPEQHPAHDGETQRAAREGLL